MRSRRWSPCVPCKAYGNRCDQTRPCARCVKLKRSCTNLDDIDSYRSQAVVSVAERPIRFHSNLSIGNESPPMIGLPPELLWASIELMKNTAIGHDVDELAHFFASLNFSDSSAIFNAMNEASNLGSRIDPPVLADDTTLQTSLTNAQNNRDMDTGADEYWDMETGTASFRTTFDPETRRRRAIVANARQATLYGIHPEEFQVSRISPFNLNAVLFQRFCCAHPPSPKSIGHTMLITRSPPHLHPSSIRALAHLPSLHSSMEGFIVHILHLQSRLIILC
jgi:hypothetical protein